MYNQHVVVNNRIQFRVTEKNSSADAKNDDDIISGMISSHNAAGCFCCRGMNSESTNWKNTICNSKKKLNKLKNKYCLIFAVILVFMFKVQRVHHVCICTNGLFFIAMVHSNKILGISQHIQYTRVETFHLIHSFIQLFINESNKLKINNSLSNGKIPKWSTLAARWQLQMELKTYFLSGIKKYTTVVRFFENSSQRPLDNSNINKMKITNIGVAKELVKLVSK